MVQPIRRSILLTATALVALGLSATIFVVLQAANQDIEDSARQELAVAARVFERVLEDRNEQLASHASLLAEDSRFRQAIAMHALSRNDQDIVSLLVAHQRSIGADLSVLVDTRGRITSNAPPGSLPESILRRLRSSDLDKLEALTVINDAPYQVVFAPIKTGSWMAWIGMGFELDTELMQSLRDITGMQASLLFQKDDDFLGLLSTLPDSLVDNLVTTGDHLVASATNFLQALEVNGWISLRYSLLHTPEAKLLLLLSTSVADDQLAYETLRGQLLTLGLLILILAGAIAAWFSWRANYSLGSLALAAQRIARGDYSKDIAAEDSGQLTVLEQAFSRMQEAIKERETHYNFQAQHDLVTGVPNRHNFDFWVKSRLLDTRPRPFGLLLLQICGLSQLTDIYGTDITNQLIRDVAKRAKSLIKPNDKLARFESDQFIIYLDACTQEHIASLRERMVEGFQEPVSAGGLDIKIETRFGMVLCPEHGTQYSDLLRRCNIALSQTFARKTDFEVYQSGQDALHLRKVQLTHSLQNAAKNDEFQLLFQPQFSIGAQKIIRTEALLRWQDKRLGPISPDEFIPLAEHSGHIVSITGWLVERAISQLAVWQKQGLGLGISINVSAQDLCQDSFVAQLIKAMSQEQLDHSMLALEITETAMIEHPDEVIYNLRQLHDFGVNIAMDDFGTGFSSLSQLKALPIDELKIDKAFIINLDQDRDDQKIVRAAIEMAHNLGLEVVAEGVENIASLAILESLGCDIIQGNYLGKPMSAPELEAWLADLDSATFMAGKGVRKMAGKV